MHPSKHQRNGLMMIANREPIGCIVCITQPGSHIHIDMCVSSVQKRCCDAVHTCICYENVVQWTPSVYVCACTTRLWVWVHSTAFATRGQCFSFECKCEWEVEKRVAAVAVYRTMGSEKIARDFLCAKIEISPFVDIILI